MSIELDGVGDVQPFNLPRIAKVQPVVRLLVLKPILYGLQYSQVIFTVADYDLTQTSLAHSVQQSSA